jgi:hypothetical protein
VIKRRYEKMKGEEKRERKVTLERRVATGSSRRVNALAFAYTAEATEKSDMVVVI